MGVAQGVIEKSGAWYSYGADRIGQGKDNVREYLRQNPAISTEIENLVRDKLGVKSRAVADKPVEDKKAAKASFEDKALAEDE
jgi:recombination protein RecA